MASGSSPPALEPVALGAYRFRGADHTLVVHVGRGAWHLAASDLARLFVQSAELNPDVLADARVREHTVRVGGAPCLASRIVGNLGRAWKLPDLERIARAPPALMLHLAGRPVDDVDPSEAAEVAQLLADKGVIFDHAPPLPHADSPPTRKRPRPDDAEPIAAEPKGPEAQRLRRMSLVAATSQLPPQQQIELERLKEQQKSIIHQQQQQQHLSTAHHPHQQQPIQQHHQQHPSSSYEHQHQQPSSDRNLRGLTINPNHGAVPSAPPTAGLPLPKTPTTARSTASQKMNATSKTLSRIGPVGPEASVYRGPGAAVVYPNGAPPPTPSTAVPPGSYRPTPENPASQQQQQQQPYPHYYQQRRLSMASAGGGVAAAPAPVGNTGNIPASRNRSLSLSSNYTNPAAAALHMAAAPSREQFHASMDFLYDALISGHALRAATGADSRPASPPLPGPDHATLAATISQLAGVVSAMERRLAAVEAACARPPAEVHDMARRLAALEHRLTAPAPIKRASMPNVLNPDNTPSPGAAPYPNQGPATRGSATFPENDGTLARGDDKISSAAKLEASAHG